MNLAIFLIGVVLSISTMILLKMVDDNEKNLRKKVYDLRYEIGNLRDELKVLESFKIRTEYNQMLTNLKSDSEFENYLKDNNLSLIDGISLYGEVLLHKRTEKYHYYSTWKRSIGNIKQDFEDYKKYKKLICCKKSKKTVAKKKK